MPVWAVALITGFVGIGTGSSYPTVTVSIQNAIAHQQIGIAMGAMNFFRALASSFVVAIMGAILLAELGASPQHGGAASTAFIASASTVSIDQLAQAFSHIFAVAVLFLVFGIIGLVIMEERPLRTTVLAVPAPQEARQPAE
jgi:hypothetical protein